MPDRYRYGDYVVLPSLTRGFFVRYRSTGSGDVIVFDGDQVNYHCLTISSLGLSAHEPSEAQCIAWAKWSLLRGVTK
jgi:hypothetical protein